MGVICVDAGTTLVKAVHYDAQGAVLAQTRRPTVVRRGRGGTSEQDMDEVWDAVASTVGKLVAGDTVGPGEPVTMLAFTGQGDGCWLVDAEGRPTGPAVLWNDARAAQIVDDWDRDGVLEAAFRINGSLAFPGTSAAILAWFAACDPDRLARSRWALSCDGWLFHRLTGVFALEASDAACPLLDLRSGQWSGEVLALYGLEWATRLLPEVRSGGGRAGELRPEAAAALGLAAGTPVVMAPFDIPATAIGIGAVRPGQACTILGTTLSTGVVLDAPDTDVAPAGMTVPSGLEGTWVRALAAMAGTDTIGWATSLLDLHEPGALSQLAGQVGAGADGLFVHPYLSPAGERAPIRDPDASGSLVGLRVGHSRAHIARAVLEGLSHVVRDCLTRSGEKAVELRLCGGGAGSEFWCQLLADVTGVPTMRSAQPEIGARGALLCALLETGNPAASVLADANSAEVLEVFEPDAELVPVYDDLFGEFLALRDTLAPTWPRIASARARHP